jgi:hypothetical protein
MAGYQAHMATGIGLGIASAILLIATVSLPLFYAPLILVAIIIGSFLPDLDSDTGLPVRILFFTLGLILSMFVGHWLFYTVEFDILRTLILTLCSFGFIYYGLQYLFNKSTKHRGIFHSLLAVVISILASNILLITLEYEIVDAGVFSTSLGVGYLGHLILDEMNSLVNLSGIPFIPKRSLGSALKIFSKSRRVNIIAVLIITCLVYLNYVQIYT